MTKLPWSPRPHSADPPPWSPGDDLRVEAIPDDRYRWVMYPRDEQQAYIAASEDSWVTGPDYDD